MPSTSGNKTFIEFVEQLEREEDIQLGTFKLGEKPIIITITPDPKKNDKDIAIPKLSPILTRKKSLAEEIAELDVSTFTCPVLPRKQDDAGSVPQRVRKGIRAVPTEGAGRAAFREAAGAIRVRDRVHRQRRKLAIL